MSKVSAQNHHTSAVHDDGGAGVRADKPFHLEGKHQPILSRRAYTRRLLRFALLATGIIGFSLALGILGYRYFVHLPWLDALLNAAMILGGMGPIDYPETVAGKLFASFYALFAGIVFLVAVGVLLAPILHRFMHRFHLELDADDED